MSIVSCYIIVNADTTVDEDFDRHQRIQITTADYSSVHLLLPADHTAAATFLNNLINTCTRLIDHIRQPHEPDTVKAEPAGATSSAHTDPPHTLQPGPHERLKRGQISCSNSSRPSTETTTASRSIEPPITSTLPRSTTPHTLKTDLFSQLKGPVRKDNGL